MANVEALPDRPCVYDDENEPAGLSRVVQRNGSSTYDQTMPFRDGTKDSAAIMETITVNDTPSGSVVGDSDSEYLPDAQADVDSDDGIPSRQQKKARKIHRPVRPEMEASKLHDDWDKWENIYTPLHEQDKEGASLDKFEKEDLRIARKRLVQLFQLVKPNDQFWKRCKNILDGRPSTINNRKRKNVQAPVQSKNGPDQGKKAPARIPSQRSVPAQRVSSQRSMPGHRRSGKPTVKEVDTTLQRFRTQALEITPDLDPKLLKSEGRELQEAVRLVGDTLEETGVNAWLLRGMKTTLFDYQFIGVGWAVRRERSRNTHSSIYNPKGGLLADEMGCGKTITMLSVIVANPPPQTARVKATLLLVQSVQMVTQWHAQIKRHCKKRTIQYSRFSKNGTLSSADLKEDRIVVATYNELERAWKRVQARNKQNASKGKQKRRAVAAGRSDDEEDGEEDEDEDEPDPEQEILIFNITWHRLILDECQLVKNHNGNLAKSVFSLDSKLQWLISATPAPNTQNEYYSYLKILKMRDTDNIRAFKKFWNSPSVKGDGTHLEVGLQDFQLHRMHNSKIAGVRIFEDVPNSINVTQSLKLSDEEMTLYNIVVKPLQREMRKLAKRKPKDKIGVVDDSKGQGAIIVSRILQMYKLTAHPFLLETIMHSKKFSLEQRLEVRTAIKRCDKQPLFKQLERFADDSARAGSIDSQALSQFSDQSSGPEVNNFNMDNQLDYSIGELADKKRCHGCHGVKIPIQAIVTQCGHAFCQKHFDRMVKDAREEDPDESAPVLCLDCDKDIGVTSNVDQTDIAAAYDFFKANPPPAAKGRAGKVGAKDKTRTRGDDFNGLQPKGERSMWLEMSDKEYPKSPLTHSTKTRAVMKTILGWQEDSSDDKIIVFTQWVMMGKIIGRHLEQAQIPFLYYFGEMTAAERTNSLTAFEQNKDIKVIVMGLKCAGQGLDMHYANRVILVDPWWNEDGERQAFARVLRKVQKKTTFFVRLMAEGSIDMRISDIQNSKREMTQALQKEYDPVRRQAIERKYAKQMSNQALGRDSDADVDDDSEEASGDECKEETDAEAEKEDRSVQGPAKKRKITLRVTPAVSLQASEPESDRHIKQEEREDTMPTEATAAESGGGGLGDQWTALLRPKPSNTE